MLQCQCSAYGPAHTAEVLHTVKRNFGDPATMEVCATCMAQLTAGPVPIWSEVKPEGSEGTSEDVG